MSEQLNSSKLALESVAFKNQETLTQKVIMESTWLLSYVNFREKVKEVKQNLSITTLKPIRIRSRNYDWKVICE